MTPIESERLSLSEMREINEVFSTIIEDAIGTFTEKQRDAIRWWIGLVEERYPHLMFAEQNFEFCHEAMENELTRDFIMRVHFVFFSSAGSSNNFLLKLTKNLFDGLCLDGPNQEYSDLLPDIKLQLPLSVFRRIQRNWFEKLIMKLGFRKNQEQMNFFLFLRNNTWIIVILLIHLCGRNGQYAPPKAET